MPPDRVLTRDQMCLLQGFFRSDIGSEFALGGGTTLAAYDLKHRLSDDLDLLCHAKDQAAATVAGMKAVEAMEKCCSEAEFTLHAETRAARRFCAVRQPQGRLRSGSSGGA
jgi:predicted nucleotidyltransferase component of viral defense system